MTKINKEQAFEAVNIAYSLQSKNGFLVEKDNFLYKYINETNDDFIIICDETKDTWKTEKKTSWDILLDSENNSNGYKAVEFLNNETKEVHIATAGTVPTDINDLIDDAYITFGYTPRKTHPMKTFVEDVIKKLGEDSSSYKFSTSGHSLGAIMSDLTAAEIISRGLDFDQSITFDNPGSRKVIETAINNKIFSGTKNVVIEEISKQCVEYNAAPNFINTIGHHLADNIYLVLPKNLQKPQETEKSNPEPTKSSSSSLFSFGKYVYNKVNNKVGSIVSKLSEKSGITSIVNQIEEHSLKNFENIDSNSVIYKVSGYEDGELKIDPLEIDKVKNIKSTGSNITLCHEEPGSDFVILRGFAFQDLKNEQDSALMGSDNPKSDQIG
jgi:hypothetical protein